MALATCAPSPKMIAARALFEPVHTARVGVVWELKRRFSSRLGSPAPRVMSAIAGIRNPVTAKESASVSRSQCMAIGFYLFASGELDRALDWYAARRRSRARQKGASLPCV